MPPTRPADGAAPSAARMLFDPDSEFERCYLDVDWAATPIGPPDQWSDSLKTTVRLMLASRFAMWMGWGPELTFFCNEAYRRDSLGGKHPWALGRPTSEVWSEIWDQLTDRVTAVTVDGQSTWDEELRLFVQRNDYLEETFHTFSYFPITEGDASIAGLLCIVSEVTEGVVSVRRITTSSALSAGLAGAATVEDVYATASHHLAADPADFPFVAAYVVDADEGCGRLAWTCGLAAGRAATPTRIDASTDAVPWAGAVRSPQLQVVEAAGLFADLDPGPEGIRPTQAVVATTTQAGAADQTGFLVVGASPHRPLDDSYLAFIQLVAQQYGSALGRARAFEAERDQAHRTAAREHAIASELQASLLPSREFDTDHLDIATFYRSGVEGTEVGGDWYDVIDLGPGRTALVIGDVMGRGVQAAAVMGQLRASVRAYAQLELPPDVVLGLLDEAVRELEDNMIVTCVYAVYDPFEHSLTYANAGHLPPILQLPGMPAQTLVDHGPPLGVGRAWPEAQTVTLPVGATLTLYTDGLVERRGSDVDLGIEHMTQMLDSSTHSLDVLPSRLVSELMPEGADDDIAVLIARVDERADFDHIATIELDHDTSQVGLARRFVARTALQWSLTDDLSFDAQLIVSELVTNALRHAHSSALLTLRRTHNRLFIEVHDSQGSVPRPRNALPSDVDGRGLAIVASLANRWGTRQTASGKAVWCELPLTDPRPTD